MLIRDQQEWPVLKIFYHVLRYIMPIEFTVVGAYIRLEPLDLYSCQLSCCVLRHQVVIREVPKLLSFRAHSHHVSCLVVFRSAILCFRLVNSANSLVPQTVVALIRLHAIFDYSKAVLGGLGALCFIQVATMAACCAFYRRK